MAFMCCGGKRSGSADATLVPVIPAPGLLRYRHALAALKLARWALLAGAGAALAAQAQPSAQPLLQQQERDRALREQLQPRRDARLQPSPAADAGLRLPQAESPCFAIHRIVLNGDAAERFQWALRAADSAEDAASGRCLGAKGINRAMQRIQNAIISRGYVTSRVLAQPQDLNSGTLQLTLVPGRIRSIRFADGVSPRANARVALPAKPGDLLNLRDIEQGLENFQRLPSVAVDIQIEAAEGPGARPGESDLVIAWRQARPLRGNLSLDDSGADETGKYLGAAALSLDNPLALNDLFYLSCNRDLGGGDDGERGSRGHTLHYSLPYGYWQFGASSSAYDYHQTVAGASQSYRYSGKSRRQELNLSRMLYRDASRKTGASLGAWSRRSQNFIEDTEIELQRRRTTGWSAGLNHVEFIGQATAQFSFDYRRGTGANNALEAPEDALGGGSSRSRIIDAEARLSLPFSVGAQSLRYSGQWRAQWNRSPLVPQEHFSLGGRHSVRGFDGDQILSADRGWLSRNDVALTLGASGQEAYVAVDYGEVGGPASKRLSSTHLAGYAVGLRGEHRGVSYELFAGQPISKPRELDTARTTAGFNISWSF